MKLLKKKFTTIVEKTKTGFPAYTKDYPVFTTGNTIPELSKDMVVALYLYYEDQKVKVMDTNLIFSLSRKVTNHIHYSHQN